MEVLCSGRIVPFHHLPPVSWEPLELPFLTSVSTKAQALQEVNKMLQKDVLKLVGHQGYYSWLLLVQKVLWWEGGVPVMDLLSLNGHIILARLKMETVSSMLGLIRKGDSIVLDWSQGCLIPDTQSSRLSTLSPDRALGGEDLPVQGSIFLTVTTAPQVFTKDWAHKRGMRLLHYLD